MLNCFAWFYFYVYFYCVTVITLLHTFLILCFKKNFFGELQKSLTAGKNAVETCQTTFKVLLWQCFGVKYQNGNVLVETAWCRKHCKVSNLCQICTYIDLTALLAMTTA